MQTFSLPISTEKRKATMANLYIPVYSTYLVSLRRGARRRRSAWRSASLFSCRTFSFPRYRESEEVKGNGGRASLRNNGASRDRASRGKIFIDRWNDLFSFYTMWDRLQWRRNVAKFKVWAPIVSWGGQRVISVISISILMVEEEKRTFVQSDPLTSQLH